MSTINTPYVYSLLTVNGDMTADEYEQWLAHALPLHCVTADIDIDIDDSPRISGTSSTR